MPARFDQPDPNLARQPKMNIILLQIIKNQWGARDSGELPFKYKQQYHVGGRNDWYPNGAVTPYVVVWPISKKTERMGIGSPQRYHHSMHRVWIFCKDPDECDECTLEVERILQKNATGPAPGVLRIDYYSGTSWQQEAPGGIGVLYRNAIDVTMIYVK